MRIRKFFQQFVRNLSIVWEGPKSGSYWLNRVRDDYDYCIISNGPAVDIKMVTADETGPAPTPEPEKERQGEEFYCEAGIQDCRTCFADGQCERQKEALSAKRAAFYPEGLWEYCDGDLLERLRSAARFPVRETGSGWIVAAGYCCLCGCDLDIHTFQSERDALLFACLLNAVGYEPPHNIACSPCHAEYMKDCI